MLAHDQIKFVQHDEIDKSKYDECVIGSINSLIYARSFYLDNICPQWCALIAPDYSWVMPITWNKKWGVRYLYQPAFTQQLGVFSKGVDVPMKQIIQVLKSNYSLWEISFNYTSLLSFDGTKFNTFTCANYILNLLKSYDSIASNYHKDLIKNLKRSRRFGLIYRPVDSYIKVIEAYIEHYSSRMKHVSTNDYNSFRNVCKTADEQRMVVCREVVNGSDELLATVLLLKDEKRLYNIMNTTTAAGRKVEANHFLLDAVIKEFAASELILDFEGSDLVGVKSFYENFGSVNQPYYKVKYNNLPWPIRLLK